MNNLLPLLLVLLLSGDGENNIMLALCLVLLLSGDGGSGDGSNGSCGCTL